MDKIINDDSMINLSEALGSLYNRREPITKIPVQEKLGGDYDPIFESVIGSVSNEGVKYILGAMQAIPKLNTDFLYQLGRDFSQNIISGMGIPLTFRFQGSVPLNVHIRSGSDLDILFLHSKNVYVPEKIYPDRYNNTNINVKDMILYIKDKCQDKFNQELYHYERNDKSIKLIKCLPVNTDIVPACWYHTKEYQLSGKEEDMGVTILKEKEKRIIPNYPFKHIYLVNNKNSMYNDRLGKCIRLLKNIKTDLANSDAITLSSFDITSFIYYMPEFLSDFINMSRNNDLALAACLLQYIQYALNNEGVFSSLYVPDNSRQIFDSHRKFSSLRILAINLSKILSIANPSGIY